MCNVQVLWTNEKGIRPFVFNLRFSFCKKNSQVFVNLHNYILCSLLSACNIVFI